jgi:hypothetical protein
MRVGRGSVVGPGRDRLTFYTTPAGRAREAFENGDQVFQYAIDVMSQQAIIVAMVGSRTSAKTTDPSVILNSVCAEGWELVNGSFVFVEQGQQSRDKFMSSGQNVQSRAPLWVLPLSPLGGKSGDAARRALAVLRIAGHDDEAMPPVR